MRDFKYFASFILFLIGLYLAVTLVFGAGPLPVNYNRLVPLACATFADLLVAIILLFPVAEMAKRIIAVLLILGNVPALLFEFKTSYFDLYLTFIIAIAIGAYLLYVSLRKKS